MQSSQILKGPNIFKKVTQKGPIFVQKRDQSKKGPHFSKKGTSDENLIYWADLIKNNFILLNAWHIICDSRDENSKITHKTWTLVKILNSKLNQSIYIFSHRNANGPVYVHLLNNYIISMTNRTTWEPLSNFWPHLGHT